MTTPDNVVADERQIAAHEDLAAKGDADRGRFIVAVAKPERVRIAGVRAAQRHEAEVAHTVMVERVVLLHDLVAKHVQRAAHEVYEPVVLDRDMRWRRRWRDQLVKRVVFNKLAARMQIQCHRTLLGWTPRCILLRRKPRLR